MSETIDDPVFALKRRLTAYLSRIPQCVVGGSANVVQDWKRDHDNATALLQEPRILTAQLVIAIEKMQRYR